MIAGPIVMFASDLVGRSTNTDTDSKYVAKVASNVGLHWLSGLLMMIGALLLLGAFIGVAHLVRGRRPALANVGGALAAGGVTAIIGWAVITMGVDTELAKSPDRAAMNRLYEKAQSSGYIAPNIILMFLFLIGVIVLAVGLWRSQAAPRWVAALLGLAMVALFVIQGNGVAALIPSVLLIVALGTIGLSVLSSSDEEWASGSLQQGSAVGQEAAAGAAA